ncbi:MAG: hypothetical protein R3236_03375, partial [Phycisphaeraceae bacterium]|nr:hypothetical protein [Phycisphaeraceae bacterium]
MMVRTAWTIMLFFGLAVSAVAQEPPSAKDAAPEPLPESLESPARTIKTFVEQMDRVLSSEESGGDWEQVYAALEVPRVAG